MRNHRGDVVATALDVLDRYGLADLTMRRLGTELGVRPSALYHHFPSKQLLLGAVADELLARGRRDRPRASWDARVDGLCHELRDAMLAYRDGAELVATVRAFGLGAATPYDEIAAALAESGLPVADVPVAARAVLHFVLGHVVDEQTHLQAGSAGAIDGEPRDASDFGLGLAIVLDGIRVRAGSPTVRVSAEG